MRLINSFGSFIHHLLNPHCPHCELLNRCQSCETLKVQLDILRHENRELMDALISSTKPVINQMSEVTFDENNNEPIRMNRTSWRTKRNILERESRERAKSLREAAKNGMTVSIEELEKAVGIVDTEEKENASEVKN